jgi:hypothetical protein
MRPFGRISLLFTIIGLSCLWIQSRQRPAIKWLPPLAAKIGFWTGEEAPLRDLDLAALGRPAVLSRDYTNPFGETVHVVLISANSIEAYHDPTVCSVGAGYTTTAERTVTPIDTVLKIRAAVLQSEEHRAMLYYWCQNRDGTSLTEGTVNGDLWQRISPKGFAYQRLFKGGVACIVQISAIVQEGDPYGAQARRNMTEFVRFINQAVCQSKPH